MLQYNDVLGGVFMTGDASTLRRRKKMLEEITANQRVAVSSLKEKFAVSSVTIGKDLAHLESEGLIIKRFGYAEVRNTDLFRQRSVIKNYENKKKIAKCALNFIEDGSSVFFYMSSTVLTLVRMLQDKKNLNVLTNSVEAAHDIAMNQGARTILLGGYYSPDYIATYGDIAVNQFNQYNIDKTFFTVNGISAEGGLMIDDPFEKNLNIAMVTYSNRKYLLAEGEKVGKTCFVKVAPVETVDVLITDSNADQEECDKIRALGVEVIIG
jgi:DeoR/GlpR family transcriptional regulator of sugar metabolism